jgi:hypothetical protein
MIIEFQQISALKYEFATQCLQEHNWDMPQALAAFNQLQVFLIYFLRFELETVTEI